MGRAGSRRRQHRLANLRIHLRRHNRQTPSMYRSVRGLTHPIAQQSKRCSDATQCIYWHAGSSLPRAIEARVQRGGPPVATGIKKPGRRYDRVTGTRHTPRGERHIATAVRTTAPRWVGVSPHLRSTAPSCTVTRHQAQSLCEKSESHVVMKPSVTPITPRWASAHARYPKNAPVQWRWRPYQCDNRTAVADATLRLSTAPLPGMDTCWSQACARSRSIPSPSAPIT